MALAFFNANALIQTHLASMPKFLQFKNFDGVC